jgi:NADH-quinone oxidoreductase subunit H
MNIFELIRDPSQIGPWFHEVLLSTGMQEWVANLIGDIIGVLLVVIVVLTSAIFLIWLERKIAARLQDRLGPNRAGPYGLLQTLADIVKLLTKEDVTPDGADRLSFNLAPALMVMLTANAMREHHEQSLAAGADLHLPKPIQAARLFAALESGMERTAAAASASSLASADDSRFG